MHTSRSARFHGFVAAWLRRRLVPYALAFGVLTGCRGHSAFEIHPQAPHLIRYNGPVQLALTALLIAPGKDSGLPWDGPGQLPQSALAGLRLVRSPGETGQLFRTLVGGGTLSAVADVLHFGANVFLSGMAAPDVQAELRVNGSLILRTAKVGNQYIPTWSGSYTTPLALRDFDQLEIRVLDRDVVFHDEIGVCTSQGMPWIDRHGYVAPESFVCVGQVWAVALRVVPAAPAARDLQMPLAPEAPGD